MMRFRDNSTIRMKIYCSNGSKRHVCNVLHLYSERRRLLSWSRTRISWNKRLMRQMLVRESIWMERGRAPRKGRARIASATSKEQEKRGDVLEVLETVASDREDLNKFEL